MGPPSPKPGGGYMELAVTELGVPPRRVNMIIDFAAVDQFGVKAAGNCDASDRDVPAELANFVAAGELDVPIATVFPFERCGRPTARSNSDTPGQTRATPAARHRAWGFVNS